ncbi:MAG: hypothetical protein HFI37_03660, partial [Lachnospiraceae bacterium]|nr:hypothetical protein [Lachnospiraceae bacterium]
MGRKRKSIAIVFAVLLGLFPVLNVYAKSMDDAQEEKKELENDLEEAKELIN